MLKTDRPVASAHVTPRRHERVAWLILFCSFAIFCLLVSSGGSALYRWWNQPEAGPITAHVSQQLAVQVQRAGLVKLEVLQENTLNPGDRLVVSEEATPGAAMTLAFGNATIALWAGTDLRIGQFGYQWNDPSAADARLALEDGQIVVELKDNRQVVEIEIGGSVGGPPVILESPGRYRLRFLEEQDPTVALAERGVGHGLEVATDIGVARVGSIEVRRGQRLIELANQMQIPGLTRWELLRDASFQQLVDSQYGRLSGSDPAWRRTSSHTVEGTIDNGQVQAVQECLDPIERTDCEDPYVRLVRKGGNTKGYVTAIKQSIDADVASYRSVKIIAEVKIVYQSLSKAGESGTECPLLLRVNYTNHIAQNVQKDYCYWSIEYPDRNGVISTLPYIETQQLPLDTWQTIEIDLKQELEHLAEIREISFQANGHDYESQIRNARLVAEGLAEVPTP